jgi:hypothetical protein
MSGKYLISSMSSETCWTSVYSYSRPLTQCSNPHASAGDSSKDCKETLGSIRYKTGPEHLMLYSTRQAKGSEKMKEILVPIVSTFIVASLEFQNASRNGGDQNCWFPVSDVILIWKT